MEWTHEGLTITINEKGQFEAPGFAYSVDSLAAAKAQITEVHKAERHSVDRTLNQVVLDHKGSPVTLRRIHEGTGAWLTEPKDIREPYYIHQPSVAQLLQQIASLDAEATTLKHRADKAIINARHGYGRQSAEGVETLIQAFLAATKLAETTWTSSLQQT